ncbi:MAG TPA: hypothetical protein VMY35_16255 [Phycisphaerae bacterium]|nr:hypothetical protein [Phycisphaerae bacterium]
MDDGGPVYPHNAGQNPGDFCRAEDGICLRDWFAGQAMAGAMAFTQDSPEYQVDDWSFVAHSAYELADAMIAERRRESAAVPTQAEKIAELERALRRRDGWWTCDGCGTEFGPEQTNVGHDCDLCSVCAESCREAECPQSPDQPASGSE